MRPAVKAAGINKSAETKYESLVNDYMASESSIRSLSKTPQKLRQIAPKSGMLGGIERNRAAASFSLRAGRMESTRISSNKLRTDSPRPGNYYAQGTNAVV